MSRIVTQSIDYMNFNSAKLCEKLCETLRDILFFLLFSQPCEEGEVVTKVRKIIQETLFASVRFHFFLTKR